MEGFSVGLLVARLVALLSAIIVLGLSANLVSGLEDYQNHEDYFCDYYGECFSSFISAIDYSTFVGVFGFVEGVVGLVAFFLSAGILSWVALVIDGLAAIFFFAGGIDLAVTFSNHFPNCTSGNSFCSQTEADIAFMFIGFVAAVAAGVLVFLGQRKS